MSGTWSDVAIFNYTMSPASVTNLYLTGVGQAVYAAPDGLGNLQPELESGLHAAASRRIDRTLDRCRRQSDIASQRADDECDHQFYRVRQ